MSKLKEGFSKLKSTWKGIQFISAKDAFRRLMIVLVTMLVLSLIMVVLDYSFGLGFQALSKIRLNSKTVKIILSVVFMIAALVIIVLETMAKPRTNGFGIAKNTDSYLSRNGKNRLEQKLHGIIRISAIVCALCAIVIYVL